MNGSQRFYDDDDDDDYEYVILTTDGFHGDFDTMSVLLVFQRRLENATKMSFT